MRETQVVRCAATIEYVSISLVFVLCLQLPNFASESSESSSSSLSKKTQTSLETASTKGSKSAGEEFDPTGSPAEAGAIKGELENISKKTEDYWAYERLGWCYERSASYGNRYSDNYYALYYWGLLKKKFGKIPETATRDCVNKANEDYSNLKAKLQADAKLGNILATRIILAIVKLYEFTTPIPATPSTKVKAPESLASRMKLKSIFDDSANFSVDGNDVRLKIGESHKGVLLKNIEGTTVELEEQGQSFKKRI